MESIETFMEMFAESAVLMELGIVDVDMLYNATKYIVPAINDTVVAMSYIMSEVAVIDRANKDEPYNLAKLFIEAVAGIVFMFLPFGYQVALDFVFLVEGIASGDKVEIILAAVGFVGDLFSIAKTTKSIARIAERVGIATSKETKLLKEVKPAKTGVCNI